MLAFSSDPQINQSVRFDAVVESRFRRPRGIRIQKTRIRDFGAGGSEGQDPAPDPVPAPPKVRNRIRSRCRRLRGARIRR
uniref:Uncharacterized protein n=1 Tax=Panagrellus redivivus TaxID=6233 RepID=A0A7E4VPY6_PANRE